ncbi:MAG: hypothetical protein ISS36_02710 [Candidatus Aenigmarchaeota archaeon]|nr:hypothetical protein [Candidatus Aenigmarchaeota archaeon]
MAKKKANILNNIRNTKAKGDVTIKLSKGLLIAIVIIVVLLGAVGFLLMGSPIGMFFGGSSIKSGEEASEAVVDVGSDVQEIASTLEELDKSLG